MLLLGNGGGKSSSRPPGEMTWRGVRGGKLKWSRRGGGGGGAKSRGPTAGVNIRKERSWNWSAVEADRKAVRGWLGIVFPRGGPPTYPPGPNLLDLYLTLHCKLNHWVSTSNLSNFVEGLAYYASSSSGDAYSDRQLTSNFYLWVDFFCVLTWFHMRIPKPCLSVCPYPEKK